MRRQWVWIIRWFQVGVIGLAGVVILGWWQSCSSVSPVEPLQESIAVDAVSDEHSQTELPEKISVPEGAGLSALPAVSVRNYPLDDVLRLHHIQVKGTHNSYHLAPSAGVKDWMYTHDPLDIQLEQHGIRQFELDIHWDAERKTFVVYHVPLVDQGTTCDTWKDCLRVFKYWSEQRPQHLPILVMIETKLSESSEPANMFETLEAETLEVFPKDRIITPDLVQGQASSLQEAVKTKGWPTLREVRGKILFFLLTSEQRTRKYTREGQGLQGRLFFVSEPLGAPYVVVSKVDDPEGNETKIQEELRKGLLIRTRADADLDAKKDVNEKRLKAALESGAHMLSSDHPKPRSDGYQLHIPDGMSARCNPITAPSSCTSAALEQLR